MNFTAEQFQRWFTFIFNSEPYPLRDSLEGGLTRTRIKEETWWEVEPRLLCAFVTHTCINAETVFKDLPDFAIENGLKHWTTGKMLHGMMREEPGFERNPPVIPPWPERRDFIRSLGPLFLKYLPKRSIVLWDWWKDFPHPNPSSFDLKPGLQLSQESKEYYKEVLDVMERLLVSQNRHIAAAAYHDLNNWKEASGRAAKLIEEFEGKF
ncbi:MAG: hypothetical protein PHS14_07800 [Elusimicrobia bacterium]|nr:hypothetical protein [Elusimicrobiota bacterium]